MAIPTYDYLEKPTNDDFMEYDYDENRYVPLVKGIKANAYVALETEWGDVDNAQCYLDLLSRVVNEVILANKNQKYRLETQYYLAHSKEARETLLKIYCDTVWYNRRDGGFMMAYNSGANLNRGKLIEFGIDKALSPIAEQMIKNTIFGTKHLKYDINTKTEFSDLTTLLAYLVTNTYITQVESDVVTESENYGDIPSSSEYYITQLLNGTYLFTELDTLSKAVANMKKYNTLGDW
jgi:hypothetical protein